MSLLQKLWRAITGTKRPEPPPVPPVIIHDPAAQGPHDLDDPFIDTKVQGRVADVIARAAQKK